MELTGTVISVTNTYEVGKNNYKKRDLVIQTNEQYPQKISIEFVQDKVGLLDNLAEGQNVNVGINIRGNEWKGKLYNSIQGWRVKVLEQNTKEPALVEEDRDELPF